MSKLQRLIFGMMVSLLLAGCGDGSVNDTIRIKSGTSSEGSANSVNGNIIVETGAVVEGDVRTVNGMVDIDEQAQTGNVKTVNGAIRLGSGAETGNLDSVNGSVRIKNGGKTGGIRLVNGTLLAAQGSRINGDAYLVNGSAELIGTRISGTLSGYSGGFMVTDASEVTGDVIIRKPKGSFSDSDKPKVVIGQNSTVGGKIIAERAIELWVHESASIGGVEGAEIQVFSGSADELD